MTKSTFRACLVCLAALISVVPAFSNEVAPLITDGPNVDARVAKAASTYQWVNSFVSPDAAIYEARIPAARLSALKSDVPSGGPLWLGVDAQVDFSFRPGMKAQSIGDAMFQGKTMVWTGTFRSEGANAVRLRLDSVDLPEGCQAVRIRCFRPRLRPLHQRRCER